VPKGRTSAGLLMYRRGARGLEVFLVHPGGPFWAGKDEGAWSLPKGEHGADEEPLGVARREFAEETGQAVEACAAGPVRFLALGSILQAGGKTVRAWAFAGDWPEGAAFQSNSFALEWPPRSGRRQEFPEVDRGQFFDLAAAREKLRPAQAPLLDRLALALAAAEEAPAGV
jgi:predicted NUDIX family NTP pyrophosphohydrolase